VRFGLTAADALKSSIQRGTQTLSSPALSIRFPNGALSFNPNNRENSGVCIDIEAVFGFAHPATMGLDPTKRKPAFASQNTAAARKRAKTIDARSLAVQSSSAALSATGELDVAAYVGAQEAAIRSLESGIQRSKAALTSRAFQQVPRSLRRRTASHNVKRVPRRLRARAKREVCAWFVCPSRVDHS
jgi:hypothetical protein